MKNRIRAVFDGITSDISGAFLLAVGIFCFAESVGIAPGGISGISIMLNHLFGVPVGFTGLVLNIPLMILSYKFISRTLTLRTLRSLVICAFVLDGIVTPFFPQFSGDRMLGAVFAGALMGAGLGIVLAGGSSTGGTDTISLMIEKKSSSIGIAKAMLIVDSIIIGISVFVFRNVESALFGVVALFCQTVVVDKLVYGRERGRLLIIISQKSRDISKRILTETGRGATFFKGEGAFSGRCTDIIFCVVRAFEYKAVKRIIFEEDERAFVITHDASQIAGEGFTAPDRDK